MLMPPQQLQSVACSVAEHEEMTAHGILSDRIGDDSLQSLKAEPTIGRAAADEHASVSGNAEHRLQLHIHQRLQQPAEPDRVEPLRHVEAQPAGQRDRAGCDALSRRRRGLQCLTGHFNQRLADRSGIGKLLAPDRERCRRQSVLPAEVSRGLATLLEESQPLGALGCGPGHPGSGFRYQRCVQGRGLQ
jgi:hypothetical protein